MCAGQNDFIRASVAQTVKRSVTAMQPFEHDTCSSASIASGCRCNVNPSVHLPQLSFAAQFELALAAHDMFRAATLQVRGREVREAQVHREAGVDAIQPVRRCSCSQCALDATAVQHALVYTVRRGSQASA